MSEDSLSDGASDGASDGRIEVVMGGTVLVNDAGRLNSNVVPNTLLPTTTATTTATTTTTATATTATTTTTYRVYKQRWLVLLTVVILNISNAGLWINIAPVSYKAAVYFDVSVEEINFFSLVYLFVSIPFCFVATFSVDQLGLKSAIHIGSILNCVGGVIRALATAGFFAEDVVFPLCLTGQVIAAMAQSFLLFIPTKVSQLWFPETSRALSTTILSMSNPLGILVTQVVSPLIVTDEEKIPALNYVFGGLAILAEIITILCVTRSKPPSPPSHSAARGERDRPPYMDQLKQTFTSPPYLLLLLALGCGVALFSSLATVAQQILCPLGYNDVFSGVAMGVMILCGFVGSAVTGIGADRTKAFTPITKVFYGLATIFGILMMEMFLLPNQPALIAISCGLFGFFGVGAYPIGLELAVEATYPVEESISTAFIFMSGQAQGVVIIAMVTLLSRKQQDEYKYLEVCTNGENSDLQPKDYTVSLLGIMALLTFVVVLLIIFFDTPYKRLEAETTSTTSTNNNNIIISDSSSSSSSQSLVATSGYGSDSPSKATTVSSGVSKRLRGVFPETREEDLDGCDGYEHCHL